MQWIGSILVDGADFLRHVMGMRPNGISFRCIRLVLIIAVGIGFAAAGDSSQDRIPAAEFSKIIKTFSEEEGYFISDNFTSNEDGYLSITKKLRDLHISGGAYIGVGPEQNFTYIAKLRPEIAFLVDIRRQAVLQHLMFKALFHLSKDRVEFLARLLSRRLAGKNAPDIHSSLRALMEYFSNAPADASYYSSNLAEIERTIQSEFEFPLSKEDRNSLTSVYKSFYTEGLDQSFKFNFSRGSRRGPGMPSLRYLIEQPDPNGKPGNFLAINDDYQFVRDLQEKNRIIPVVGDFAGRKAFRAIAGYLRDHSYTVNAFYTSNVEMYLFEDGVFTDFVENVKALPIKPDSLFIRSSQNRYLNPYPDYRMATLLQYISVFLKDQKGGLYSDYPTLVNTHHIPLNP
jgi:hypothetical protein